MVGWLGGGPWEWTREAHRPRLATARGEPGDGIGRVVGGGVGCGRCGGAGGVVGGGAGVGAHLGGVGGVFDRALGDVLRLVLLPSVL